ncbi:MAG: cyclase family protein [Candidatus Margulisiibacteriota bacterium]|nr:cyclase family protein [Candidatus Margulisiibacteriota bacterium]
MKYYDISIPVSNHMHNWPGDEPAQVVVSKTIDGGHDSNITVIKMHSHCGTHLDAPHHMISGAQKVDEISLDILIGKAQVIEISDPKQITAKELEAKFQEGSDRVLFKTRNSNRWSEQDFFKDFVHLTLDGAKFLTGKKIKLVGIDYLSIDEYGVKDHLPHKELLSNKVVILEGIDLSNIAPGDYELICLPLKITGADGAPARAVLKG